VADGEPIRDPETNVIATDKANPPPRFNLGSYGWLNTLEVPFFILGFLSLTVGWAAILHYLGEEHAKTFQPVVFLFKPFQYWLIFALPAFVMGVFTVIPVFVLLIYFSLGCRRFMEYAFWDEGRMASQGTNTELLIRRLDQVAILLGALCAVFVFLVMSWHARFSENEIAIHRFWGFGEEIHPYSDVTQVVVSSHRKQDKQLVVGQDLGLRFRGGRTWYSTDILRMPDHPEERKRLLDFLQQKTGQPITRVRLLKDLPDW